MARLPGDRWAMLLAVRARHKQGRGLGSDAQMAQEAGFAPHGQLTKPVQRRRAQDALVELEHEDIIVREGGNRRIDAEKLARALDAA